MTQKMRNFKVKEVHSMDDIIDGKIKDLPTSDLAFQATHSKNGTEHVVQFEYIDDEEMREKTIIKPGLWIVSSSMSGLLLEKFEFRKRNLLESINNTKLIREQAQDFFSAETQKMYKDLEIEDVPKRGVLFYGSPGQGKTANIERVCQELLAEDKGTVIINWHTGMVRASDMLKFLQSNSKYHESATRLILIAEDIGSQGGQDYEGHYGPRGVDSALLNLLDGTGKTFFIPTFIIATTNHPENLKESLLRAGRFDEVIELPSPEADEREQLLEFFKKEALTDDEKSSIRSKDADGFSIAFIREIFVRSKLRKRSIPTVIKEIKDFKKLFKQSFDKKSKDLGL